jgi:hypothetical protein
MQPKYLRSDVNHLMIAQWVNEGLIKKSFYSDQIVKYYPVLGLDELEPLSHLLCDHDYKGIEAQFELIYERNSKKFNQENLSVASRRDHPRDYYQATALRFVAYSSSTLATAISKTASSVIWFARYRTEDFFGLAAIAGVLSIGIFVGTLPFTTQHDARITFERSDKDTSNGSFVLNYNYSDSEVLVSPKEDFKTVELEIQFKDTPDLAFITITRGEFTPINKSLRFDLEKRFGELKFVKPSGVRITKVYR